MTLPIRSARSVDVDPEAAADLVAALNAAYDLREHTRADAEFKLAAVRGGAGVARVVRRGTTRTL